MCNVVIAPRFLKLGSGWRWVVSFQHALNRRLGGRQKRSVGFEEEINPLPLLGVES